MFHDLREGGSQERSKAALKTAALAFLVVLLAVFAAQALIDWNRHRQALAAVEAVKQKADRDVAFHYAVALGWKTAVPCLEQRMTEVMRQLGSGRPLDPRLLQRPAMEGGNLPLPGESDRRLLAERYGANRAQDYWAASQNVANLAGQVTDMIRAWSGFAIVDPSNGPVGELDRHEARLAAGRVKTALEALDINADNVIGRARAIGVNPDSQREFRPIANCEDLWRNRMTHPSPEMR